MRLTNGEFDCYIHTLRRAADSIGCDLTVIHRRNNLQFGTSSSYKSDDSPSPSPTTTTTTTTSNILPSSTSNTASSSTSNNFTSSNGGTLMEISSNDQLSRHIQHSHHQHQSAVYNYAHVLIRQRGGVVENILELRVAVVGNVGKKKGRGGISGERRILFDTHNPIRKTLENPLSWAS